MASRYFVKYGHTFCVSKLENDRYIARHVDSGLGIYPWPIVCEMAEVPFGAGTKEKAIEVANIFMESLGEQETKKQLEINHA